MHPEAMDPELNSNRNSISEEYQPAGNDFPTAPRQDGEVMQVDKLDHSKAEQPPHHTDDLKVIVTKVGGDSDVDTEGCVVDEEGRVAVKQGCGKLEGRATTDISEVVVEDPWETWNTVRMMCDHKTG